MFGLLRTLLAIIVMLGHLLDKWQIGTYAVFGFYMISGYLMTCIMHESYGFNARGRLRFVLNRFLRLYPLYWCAAIISLFMIAFIGSEFVLSYNSSIYLPQTTADIFANLSMVYPMLFSNEYKPILVPTTWAITVELFFYAAICLGLSKTRFRVTVWLGLSLLYIMVCFYHDLGWRYRYFPIFAGSLPFAMGAYIYFLKKDGMPFLTEALFQPPLLLCGMLVNMLAVMVFKIYFEMGFYINAFFSILLCYQLATGAGWGSLYAKASPRLDKIIGEFSYPIYLLHWQAGIIAAYLLLQEPVHNTSMDGIKSLALAFVLVFVTTFVLIRAIDRPVQKWRMRVKSAG